VNSILWKPVKGYEESYEVSTTGIVKSKDRLITNRDLISRFVKGNIITQHTNNYGYNTVKLSYKNKTNTCLVHRIIAEAFLPNPNNLPEVNHKSGIKSDNSLSNLEWVTHRENTQHAYDTGLSSNQKGTHYFAVSVVDNKLGKSFTNIKDWCHARGINYSTGRNILSGNNKSKTIDLSEITLQRKVRV
jgi:hypothetical protein